MTTLQKRPPKRYNPLREGLQSNRVYLLGALVPVLAIGIGFVLMMALAPSTATVAVAITVVVILTGVVLTGIVTMLGDDEGEDAHR